MNKKYVYQLSGRELMNIRKRYEDSWSFRHDLKTNNYTWGKLLMAKLSDPCVEAIIYPEMDYAPEGWSWKDPLDKPATEISVWDVYSPSELL